MANVLRFKTKKAAVAFFEKKIATEDKRVVGARTLKRKILVGLGYAGATAVLLAAYGFAGWLEHL